MEVLNEYGAVKYFGVNTFTTGIFRSWFSFGDVTGAIQLACIYTSFNSALFFCFGSSFPEEIKVLLPKKYANQ